MPEPAPDPEPAQLPKLPEPARPASRVRFRLLLNGGGVLAGLLLWWRLATAGTHHFNQALTFLLAATAVALVLVLVNLVGAGQALWRRQWGLAALGGAAAALWWVLLREVLETAGGLGRMGHH